MNPLTDILPAHLRRRAYLVFVGIGVFIGALQVGFVTAQLDQPTWLTVGIAIYTYLGIALGLTAASNTGTTVRNLPPSMPPEGLGDDVLFDSSKDQ